MRERECSKCCFGLTLIRCSLLIGIVVFGFATLLRARSDISEPRESSVYRVPAWVNGDKYHVLIQVASYGRQREVTTSCRITMASYAVAMMLDDQNRDVSIENHAYPIAIESIIAPRSVECRATDGTIQVFRMAWTDPGDSSTQADTEIVAWDADGYAILLTNADGIQRPIAPGRQVDASGILYIVTNATLSTLPLAVGSVFAAWGVGKFCLKFAQRGPGFCQQCGYDLRPSASTRCPECGLQKNPVSSQRIREVTNSSGK